MSGRSKFGEAEVLLTIPRARDEELRLSIESHVGSGRRWGRLHVWYRAGDGTMRPGADHVSIKPAEVDQVLVALEAMRGKLAGGGVP